MREKLIKLKARYEELGRLLSAPDAMADMNAWKELSRERAQLEEIVAVIDQYEKNLREQEGCRELLEEGLDPDMKELTLSELDELKTAEERLTEELKILLLPKDPNDERDVILEIRAGTGGEEASLFGSDLLRMYQRYAERHRYQVEFVEDNRTEMGGVKEVVLTLSGKGAYSRLKFESGVHRVQRVPETESQGRIHTSAATVAVMPQVDEVQVEIKDSDIQIDTYRSSGAGGQHVNKTSSAIRITHIPTGIVVACQDERSQYKNKDKAMQVLRSRIYDLYQSKQDAAVSSARKSMVGSGDRSERIRTYNFPQNRVTDHRINFTLYKLEQFMDGDMDELIDALILEERARKLSGEE